MSTIVGLTAYDIRVLTIIVILTLAVFILLLLIALSGVTVGNLWFMPAGWFVGAVMVWAYGKYNGR